MTGRKPGSAILRHQVPPGPHPREADPAATRAVNRQGLYDQAMQTDSTTMDFIINRPEGEDPELTFSVDALETVGDAMNVFMATRFRRHFDAGKTGPKKLRATVTITLDDEPVIDDPSTRPFLIMDGGHRTH